MRFCFCFLLFFFLSLEAKESKTLGSSFCSNSGSPIIVVDAGHGGRDRGTKSKTPFCEEKRLCLQTARLVKKYLDQLGFRVVMTRNTDTFIPLPRRVEIAKQSGSSLLVSIHYNSAPNPTAHGVEIFFHDSKENRSKALSSKKLSEVILSGIVKRTKLHSRGVKKGNFFVLRESSMPAIIIEGGFISNPKECSTLKSLSYQDNLARAIADGIDRYFKMKI